MHDICFHMFFSAEEGELPGLICHEVSPSAANVRRGAPRKKDATGKRPLQSLCGCEYLLWETESREIFFGESSGSQRVE